MHMELLPEIMDVLENNRGSVMANTALSGGPFLLDRCEDKNDVSKIQNTYNGNMVFSEVLKDNFYSYVLALGSYKGETGKFKIDTNDIAGYELFPKSEYMPSCFMIGNNNLQTVPHITADRFIANQFKSNKSACEQFGLAALEIWDVSQIVDFSSCISILKSHSSDVASAALDGQPFILSSFSLGDDMFNELSFMLNGSKWMTEDWTDDDTIYHLTLITLKKRDFVGQSALDQNGNILFSLT